MPLFQTARFEVKPEGREKCEQAIREFVEYVKTQEQGRLRAHNLLLAYLAAGGATRHRLVLGIPLVRV